MAVLLIRVDTDVPALGIARVEVVALEFADDRLGGLRLVERRSDIVDADQTTKPVWPLTSAGVSRSSGEWNTTSAFPAVSQLELASLPVPDRRPITSE
jgi:hypothetical protein